jgi:hypothetical protein
VGHQRLFFAQFPPKNLKVAVHLQDVTSIRMVRAFSPRCQTGLGWAGHRGCYAKKLGQEKQRGHVVYVYSTPNATTGCEVIEAHVCLLDVMVVMTNRSHACA